MINQVSPGVKSTNVMERNAIENKNKYNWKYTIANITGLLQYRQMIKSLHQREYGKSIDEFLLGSIKLGLCCVISSYGIFKLKEIIDFGFNKTNPFYIDWSCKNSEDSKCIANAVNPNTCSLCHLLPFSSGSEACQKVNELHSQWEVFNQGKHPKGCTFAIDICGSGKETGVCID
jgi:hypothetical protein